MDEPLPSPQPPPPPQLPRQPPPSGAALLREGGDELRKGPPSYTRALLVVLSCLLLVPLGIGTGRLFRGCSEASMPAGYAEVYGTELDQGQLVYQLVREQGFNAGHGARERGADLRRLLDRPITVLVLARHAEDQGLDVSAAELAGYLKDPNKNGDFPLLVGDGGGFDAQRYPQVVQYGFHLSLRRYEQYKRAELLARKALEQLGPEARGPEVAPGLGATEVWLFHPLLAARLGAQAPGPGPQVWALVEQARAAGKVRVNEARFTGKP